MSQPPIERRELLKTVFKNGVFTSADIREIRLQPGQQSGRHLHPCAVLGYIVKGTATYQIEGEAEQILPAGSAFHEPAGAIVANFRQCVRFRTDDFRRFLPVERRARAHPNARSAVNKRRS